MFVRIVIGVGLFAIGYFVGKEIGRAESIRDQLNWAADEDDSGPTKRRPEGDIQTATSGPSAPPRRGS